MKTFSKFLVEADTSGATKTEMAIVYAYNKIKNPKASDKDILAMGMMDKAKWSSVDKNTRVIGKKTAEEMGNDGGSSLIHAGSSSASTHYKGGSDTTSKADLYSSDKSQFRYSLKAGGGAQLMSAKSGEATGVFNYGLKHFLQNNKKAVVDGLDGAIQILKEDMANSSRSKMFVEVGKSKENFGDWFILKSHRHDDIATELTKHSKFDTQYYLEVDKNGIYTVKQITGDDWYVHMKAELQILNIVSGNAKKAKEKLFKFPSKDLMKKLADLKKGKTVLRVAKFKKSDAVKLAKAKNPKFDPDDPEFKGVNIFTQIKSFTKAHLGSYYKEFQELGNAKIGDVTVSQSNLKNATPADLSKTNLRSQIIDVIQISVEAQGWKEELVKFFNNNEELKKWVVYEAASGYGKFIGKASAKSSYSGGSGDSDNAVANKLLVFKATGGVADNKDVFDWSMKNGNLVNDMDISFKGSGTSRYIKFGIPTKAESVMHEEAETVLDNIIDNEFIKLEAEIYHLGQLDEGFLDFVKGTFNKAKDFASAAAKKLKELVAKFYESVIKTFIEFVKTWIAKGFDFFMEMMGLSVDSNVSMSDASF
jgi:hypothetical protein